MNGPQLWDGKTDILELAKKNDGLDSLKVDLVKIFGAFPNSMISLKDSPKTPDIKSIKKDKPWKVKKKRKTPAKPVVYKCSDHPLHIKYGRCGKPYSSKNDPLRGMMATAVGGFSTMGQGQCKKSLRYA